MGQTKGCLPFHFTLCSSTAWCTQCSICDTYPLLANSCQENFQKAIRDVCIFQEDEWENTYTFNSSKNLDRELFYIHTCCLPDLGSNVLYLIHFLTKLCSYLGIHDSFPIGSHGESIPSYFFFHSNVVLQVHSDLPPKMNYYQKESIPSSDVISYPPEKTYPHNN